ncbi:hypothetical protein FOL47_011138 [Perkinsus chesapeaki]|uniref:Uncharacterized protein n=1 Tax=Perkinsus chesapeaki TaxID=330153 RepID=A0A7J6KZL2_PERCH|nr:hypothetical protein FOL47_011138 [Perkinsus chesapeaki]
MSEVGAGAPADEVLEVLHLICDSDVTVQKLSDFLVSSQVTKARALACLAPGLIAAATSAITPPEGTTASVWKGTVASLLQAAREEASDQLNHRVQQATRDIQSKSPGVPIRGNSRGSRHRRVFAKAMKSVASRIGNTDFPTSLVPPQKVLEVLYLNPGAYIDFEKYFLSSPDPSSSGGFEGSLAEDMEGNPVVVKSFRSSDSTEKGKPMKNYSAKWSRAFIIYSLAVLIIQDCRCTTSKDSVDLGSPTESSDDESSDEADDKLSILDMLMFYDRILWYAAEYNWSVASLVDKTIRQAIDSACRSGTKSLAQCYQSFDLWSGKASEAVGLAMNSQTFYRSKGSPHQESTTQATSSFRGTSQSQRPFNPSKQGTKRVFESRGFTQPPPPPKQSSAGSFRSEFSHK